jgi:hypothetical protein
MGRHTPAVIGHGVLNATAPAGVRRALSNMSSYFIATPVRAYRRPTQASISVFALSLA